MFIAKCELLLADASISRNVENGEQFSHDRAVQTENKNLLFDDIVFNKSPVGHTIGVSEQCSAKLSKLHNVDSSASSKEFIIGVEKNVTFLPISFFGSVRSSRSGNLRPSRS